MLTKTTRLAELSVRLLGAQGATASVSPRAAAAIKVIDPENVSSVSGILNLLAQSIDAVNRDPELSPEGKRNRISAAASSRLGNIADSAKVVVHLEAEHRRDADEAVPLPKAEPADVLLDLALVAHVKADSPIPTKLLFASERVRLAVARTPPELAGISPEVQAQVRGSLVDPHKAVQLGAEAEAIGAARKIVQRAIDDLAPDAQWTPQEMVRHFGTQWRLPGITSTKAERLATEGAGGSGGGGE